MKVLYSCLSKSWGGMEMYTLTSIRQLLKRNVKVELICSAESRIHIEANNMGIIIYPIRAGSYLHPVTTIRLSLIIKNGEYSLVHTQASKDLWLLVPALVLANSKIPLFLTKQVGSFIIKKDYFHNLLYKRVNKIFAISQIIRKNLMETTSADKDDIIILPNGVDVNRFNPDVADRGKVRADFKIQPDQIVIGMLARFTQGKGHEEFLSAARELNKDYSEGSKGKKLFYLVVGEPSRGENDYADKIKHLAKDFKLDNIIFTGFRGDTPEVLAAMDIFAFPSHSEAFGIALVEAMAMKKPSVCSNSDGVLDIAVDGETSLLFENKNYYDLKDKLKVLIESKELQRRLGENARKRVLEKFDLEKVTDEVLQFYRQEIQKVS